MIEIGSSFGIANFKSFNEVGVYITNLNKVNIFIGKNNSGKSNVLNFIKTLRDSKVNVNSEWQLKTFPSEIEYQYNRNGKFPDLILNFSSTKFNIDEFFIKYSLSSSKNMKILDTTRYFAVNITNHINKDFIPSKIKKLKQVIYIPNFRYIQEKNKVVDSNSSIDGSNIISKMFDMQHPEVGNEKDKQNFFKIQNLLQDLLNAENLSIEIPNTKDKIIVELYDNRLPLSSYGTGIHQLVLLCSAIVINPDTIICIEEPEVHLHPELQRKFLSFLENETDNIFFITTHSNIFLEYSKLKNIYHVKYNNEYTTIHKSETNEESYHILNDLGYKQSDLLQSNGIIWVEGPSDRVYLKKWLSLLSDYKFIEGIHYSIMFYGGRLLSHLSFKTDLIEENVIPLLKINKNAFVLIDKDGKRINNKLNDTKERVISESGENSFWVTEGREIENYLSEKTVKEWLKNRLKKNINFQYDKNEKIEESILKCKTTFDYSKGKNKYSKEIIDFIDKEDMEVLDLKQKMNNLIQEIKKWNNIK